MSIQRNRERFGVKGLGKLYAREVSPTSGAYADLGYLDETNFDHLKEMEPINDENGAVYNVAEKSSAGRLGSSLLQVSQDEIDFIKGASGKVHALQYFGKVNENNLFQYYCLEKAIIDPSTERKFVKGKQVLPLRAFAIKQNELAYDVPEYYLIETNGEMHIDGLQLWISPRRGWNAETAKVLDASGFGRHGTLNSDFATIWQGPGTTPDRYFLFDGVNDECTFGNVCNLNNTDDFFLSLWFNIAAADSTEQCMVSKGQGNLDTNAGWSLFRATNNKFYFQISDGSNIGAVATTTNVTTNVVNHIFIAGDRNGNATLFLNGVQEAQASIASVGAGSSVATDLYFARTVAGKFSNVKLLGFQMHNFGAAGLPSNYAAIALNHYNAEKTIYGL